MQLCDFNKVALHFDILTLRVLHLHAFDTFLGRCKTFLVSDMTRIVCGHRQITQGKKIQTVFFIFFIIYQYLFTKLH